MLARRVDLDFVRGIAILLAMGWHFNGRNTGIVVIDLIQLPGRFFGWAGVDIFFVLSGFLVGGLIFREYDSSKSFDAKRFLVRRAFKIWPILYLYIAILVISGRYEWKQIDPQTVFHVQNFFVTPLNHLWSLAVEEHFYVAFAALFAWLNRVRLQPSLLQKIIVFIIIVVPGLRLLGILCGLEPRTLQWQTEFRIDALACGVLIAHTQVFYNDKFRMIIEQKVAAGCILIISAAFILLVRSNINIIATIGYTASYLAGASLLVLVYGMNFVGKYGRFARAVAWIGMYSYPMYVFQFSMLRVEQAIWMRFKLGPIPALVELVMSYVGAIIIALILAKLVEKPILWLRDKIFPAYARRPNLQYSPGAT
jgi:peptidoglycan/LPS O-acetylase OafA/YrhL